MSPFLARSEFPNERSLPEEDINRDSSEVYRASLHMLTKNATEVALTTEVQVVPTLDQISVTAEKSRATDEEHEA